MHNPYQYLINWHDVSVLYNDSNIMTYHDLHHIMANHGWLDPGSTLTNILIQKIYTMR